MIIGICDDEKNVRSVIESYIRKVDDACNILHFANGEEVLKYVGQGKRLDVIYLDIDLKGSPDGMEVASRLKSKQIERGIGASALPLIIFVTGIPERMPEAFGVRAFQFLVKPIEEKIFYSVYEEAKKAAQNAPKAHQNKRISVNSKGVKSTIIISDILYIESKGRKMVFHTKSKPFEIYGTVADIRKELDESFYQIHRSFIVNMSYITDYTRNSVKMTTGIIVPMSKHKYGEFVRDYALFLENEL